MPGTKSVWHLALAYWLGVFALGFVLGTLRTLWLEPALGQLPAVALELPVMLAASWWWSGRVLARWPQPTRRVALGAGALAFALLLASEWTLAMALGQTGAEWLAALARPAGALGLAGQVLFALFPAARWRAA